jgi:hypothetical protein
MSEPLSGILRYSRESSAICPRTARRPVDWQCLIACHRQQDWRCKLAHFEHKLFQIVPLFSEPASANKRAPLERPRWIFIIGFAESNGFWLDQRSPCAGRSR